MSIYGSKYRFFFQKKDLARISNVKNFNVRNMEEWMRVRERKKKVDFERASDNFMDVRDEGEAMPQAKKFFF